MSETLALPTHLPLSVYPIGQLSDRIGRVRLLARLIFTVRARLHRLRFCSGSLAGKGTVAFYSLYLGMSQGVLLALVANQIPPNLRGMAFRLINLVIGVALLPASLLLAGGLWQGFGAEATFIAGSIFAVAATALLLATSTTLQSHK